MLNKIKQFFNSKDERIEKTGKSKVVETPEQDPRNQSPPDKKPLIEFEVNNSYDVKELRRTADRLEDEAKTLRKIADRMEKGYNIQVGDVKDE